VELPSCNLRVESTTCPIIRSHLILHQAAYLSHRSYLSVESCMAVASRPGPRPGRDWPLTRFIPGNVRLSCMEGSWESGCDNITPDRRRIEKVLVATLPLASAIDCTRVKRARDSIYQQIKIENGPGELPQYRIERVKW
jgi:hypothetical protein